MESTGDFGVLRLTDLPVRVLGRPHAAETHRERLVAAGPQTDATWTARIFNDPPGLSLP